VTSHNPIAGAPLFSEVVAGEEGRAMTLDSGPSEALGRGRDRARFQVSGVSQRLSPGAI
jgi:hypothetical protein